MKQTNEDGCISNSNQYLGQYQSGRSRKNYQSKILLLKQDTFNFTNSTMYYYSSRRIDISNYEAQITVHMQVHWFMYFQFSFKDCCNNKKNLQFTDSKKHAAPPFLCSAASVQFMLMTMVQCIVTALYLKPMDYSLSMCFVFVVMFVRHPMSRFQD